MAILKNISAKLFSKISELVRMKPGLISFISYPDCADNSYAYLIYRSKQKAREKLIYLVKDVEQVKLQMSVEVNVNLNNIEIVKKNTIKGLYLFLRSEYVYFTHGHYWFLAHYKSKGSLVNLWHGMPLKNIGYLDGKDQLSIPKCNFVLSSGGVFSRIMQEAFKLRPDEVIEFGQPRNDWLFQEDRDVLIDLPKEFQRDFILWLPTYRASNVGDERTDCLNYDKTKGLMQGWIGFDQIQEILEKNKKYMVVKLHPMDVLNRASMQKYSNILIINNQSIGNYNVYDLMRVSAKLLTDFSSASIDYMLMAKPIGLLMPDIDKYKRGFVFGNKIEDYLVGSVIKTKADLDKYISESNPSIEYVKKMEVYNKYTDHRSSERLYLWEVNRQHAQI